MRQDWPAGAPANPEVEAELERLPATPIVELRKRYRELFKAEPPKAFGPDLLRRSIAHRIQERAYGGLSAPTRRLLDQLVKAAVAKPGARLELPRRIKPGSEWCGRGVGGPIGSSCWRRALLTTARPSQAYRR